MTEDEDPYPQWEQPASRGDVIQAIVWMRGALVPIGSALIAINNGDDKAYREALQKYFDAQSELGKLIAKMSGRADG